MTYLVFGKADTAPVELADVEEGRGGFAIRGAGSRVSGAGNVNGDGLPDLVVGAPYEESYVVFGKRDTRPIELADVEEGHGGFAIHGAAFDRAGRSVSGAGDVNGDGIPDLLVAADLPGARYPSLSRAAYVVFGRRSPGARPRFRRGDCNDDGTVDVSDAIFILGSLFLGEGDPGCDDACDSNDDGTVDISDAIATLGVLFLGNGIIPLPGMMECGVDPTADEVGCDTFDRCP